MVCQAIPDQINGSAYLKSRTVTTTTGESRAIGTIAATLQPKAAALSEAASLGRPARGGAHPPRGDVKRRPRPVWPVHRTIKSLTPMAPSAGRWLSKSEAARCRCSHYIPGGGGSVGSCTRISSRATREHESLASRTGCGRNTTATASVRTIIHVAPSAAQPPFSHQPATAIQRAAVCIPSHGLGARANAAGPLSNANPLFQSATDSRRAVSFSLRAFVPAGRGRFQGSRVLQLDRHSGPPAIRTRPDRWGTSTPIAGAAWSVSPSRTPS